MTKNTKTILAIETSCDETALCIMECSGKFPSAAFRILSNRLLSQVKIHAKYGGVFPNLAKREHGRNLIPLLKQSLQESKFVNTNYKTQDTKQYSQSKIGKIKKLLEREGELCDQFLAYIPAIPKPPLDAIAITHGPGLEPALWVGINFAKALSLAWNVPIIPINHMEGHIVSALLTKSKAPRPTEQFQTFGRESQKSEVFYEIKNIRFPALALLISGGHTEIVLSKKWLDYRIVGQTRDDAVGEAFDKVARMLNLPYPGGPAIAQQALQWKSQLQNPNNKLGSKNIVFPRPMLQTNDFDFSFSGLKTSVLYFLKNFSKVKPRLKKEVAYEFQEAVTDVLVAKIIRAAKYYQTKTILVGGGVSANDNIRETIAKKAEQGKLKILVSPKELTGDNALMIGAAAYARISLRKIGVYSSAIKANGNLRLSQ